MNAISFNDSHAPRVALNPNDSRFFDDPLDPDQDDDVVVITSRRGLTRLALVAAETGARFQRDAIGHDAMSWLLAPREMFHGAAAVEACLDRDHCLRAMLLHGLSIGLDAKPARFDEMLADDTETDNLTSPRFANAQGAGSNSMPARRRARLYSATVTVVGRDEILRAFHASVAPSAAVVRERIRARLGSAAAGQAQICVGFDPNCPLAMGMVPPAIIDTLTSTARRTRYAPPAGLDITVEQRLPG